MSEGANEWRCRCRKPGPARLAGAAHTRGTRLRRPPPAWAHCVGCHRPGRSAKLQPRPLLVASRQPGREAPAGRGEDRSCLVPAQHPAVHHAPPFPQLRGGKCREDTESGWPCWSLCGYRALHRGPGGGLRGPELPALSNPGLILGSLGALAAGAECPPTSGTMAFRGLGPDWKLENHGWVQWVGSRRLALCPAPTCSCLRSQLGVSPVPSP